MEVDSLPIDAFAPPEMFSALLRTIPSNSPPLSFTRNEDRRRTRQNALSFPVTHDPTIQGTAQSQSY
jgi:hypothetical protein